MSTRFVATTGAVNVDGMLDLLADVGASKCIGQEEGVLVPNGVSRLSSGCGSFRYLYCENGERLAVLQVMSIDGVHGVATNVFTLPSVRRRGVARLLMAKAREDFGCFSYSEDVTSDGAALLNAIEEVDQSLDEECGLVESRMQTGG